MRMLCRIPVLLVYCILLVASHRFARAAPESAVSQIQRLVVAVDATDVDGMARASGLGFFVSPTLIACDVAVVDAGRHYDVTTADERKLEVDGAVRMDAGLECVLLRTTWPQERIEPPSFVQELVKGDQELTVVTRDKAVKCRVATIEKPADRMVITLSMEEDIAASGAPVLDRGGSIVGMLCLRGVGATRTATLVPGKALELIRASAPPMPASGAPPSRTELGELRDFASFVPHLKPEEGTPPADLLKRLSASHQNLMREQAKWYVRSPDGRCFNAYRTLRYLELRNNPPGRGRELEQFAGEPPAPPKNKAEETVVHEGTPDWWDAKQECIVCSGLEEHVRLVPHKRLGDGVWICSLEGQALQMGQILVRDTGGVCAAPEAPIIDPVVVLATGSAELHGRTWRSFEAFKLADLRPTPVQLAWSVLQNKAKIVVHTVRTSEVQPTETIRYAGRYKAYRKVVNSGPKVITHRWKSVEVEVRFRPESPGSTD